jgi:DNA-binding phage protein
MKINEDILKSWQELKSHGDVKLLARKAGCTRQTIYRALNGEGTYQLIKIINNFYKQKKQELCKLSD